MNIYLLHYNNYYNRIIKKFDNLQEYEDGGYVIANYSDINFNPNDGVSTTLILDHTGEAPDYALIVDEMNGQIVSRWYVIEAVRTRGGQYEVTLYRDLVADWYDEVMTCDTYIEKATLPASSPLLCNTENFSVNQIKTKETLLKDLTECAWVVGYLAKNTPQENLTTNIKLEAEVTDAISINSTLEDWEYYDAISVVDGVDLGHTPKKTPPSVFKYITDNARGVGPRVLTTYGVNGNGSTTETAGNSSLDPTQLNSLKGQNNPTLTAQIQNAFRSYGLSRLENETYPYLTNILTPEQWSKLVSYRNAKIITSDNKIYRIDISVSSSSQNAFTIPYSSGLGLTLAQIYRNSGSFYSFNNTRNYKVEVTASYIAIRATRIYADEYSVSIQDERVKTVDAPYDIFCIPYGNITIRDAGGAILTRTMEEIAVPTAMTLATNASDFVYDIQLLPYCPIPGLITFPIIGPGVKAEITVNSDTQFTPIKKGDDIVSCIFHVSDSKFSFNISNYMPLPASNVEQKIVNQCDKYRLCSPNYSNYFDFNLSRNGTISYFEVDCQYKPYIPYIHIVPQFGKLYGQDFNDPRGLVLGGDFALPQITSAWKQFEVNNKNYQLSFDRQIQSMELHHSIAELDDVVNAVAGTYQGMMSGMNIGSMMGGAGPVLGTALGGLMSGVAGQMDVKLNRMLRDDAKDLTKDLFGYQLGNIKALPLTISKLSSFTPNNKIFPVLEYYTCTDEERTAFVKKLANNGMTVGIIGNITNFIGDWEYEGIRNRNYVKGQIINIDVIDDFHVANSLAQEINKGVYII